MATITTTIKREFLAQIISGTKKAEYRTIKPYWTRRLANIGVPFRMRLINGMIANAPEVTVKVSNIRTDRATKQYRLTIARVISYKNWDKKKGSPR